MAGNPEYRGDAPAAREEILGREARPLLAKPEPQPQQRDCHFRDKMTKSSRIK